MLVQCRETGKIHDPEVVETVNRKEARLVQCRGTGKWYDPEVEFYKILSSKEFIAMLKRLKDR